MTDQASSSSLTLTAVAPASAASSSLASVSSSEVWPRARLFLCGGIAGIANLTVGHPLDTIKVRMQTEGTMGRFAGPWDCFKQTIRSEGVMGLYKGFTPPLLGRVITHSMMFGIQGGVLRELGAASDQPREQLMRTAPLSHIWLSGLAAGMGMISVCTPIDQVKACLQVQYAEERAAQRVVGSSSSIMTTAVRSAAASTSSVTAAMTAVTSNTNVAKSLLSPSPLSSHASSSIGVAMRYSGPIDCATKLVRQYGIYRGLYAYWFPSALELAALSVYFTAYAAAFRTLVPVATAKDSIAPPPLLPPSLAAALSGACGGGAMMLTSYPFDVIRYRLMAQPRIPGQPLKYTNMIDCTRRVWAAEGPRAFVSGFMPGLGRSFIANAAGFTAFELSLRIIPQQL